MVRFVSTLTIAVLSMSACKEEGITNTGPLLPDIELSTLRVNFGEVAWGESAWSEATLTNHGDLPLGISSLALGTNEMEENFQLQWSSIDVSCPEGAVPDEETSARAIPDEDEGATTTTATGQTTILHPGCKLDFRMGVTPATVGPMYGSVQIEMVDDDSDEPVYHKDPDHQREVILLEASGTKGAGNAVISPRNMDFGHPWTADPLIDYIRVHNVGNGTLTVGAPTIDEDCDPSIWVDLYDIAEGTVLDPYTSTLIPVHYMPESKDKVECKVTIPTNDIDAPSITVTIKGNEGDDPGCTPPTVVILSPAPGTIHDTMDDLEIELKVFDAQQPATTLDCDIASAVLGEWDKIADCTPTDESGYIVVQIPATELLTGHDTIVVTVEDDCDFEVSAGVSVLIRTSHTANDGDGDGFDELSTIPDCDDDNPATYPFATEIYDGLDNDCDGEIDENTEGSDDDGDGMSEIEGDCNDADQTTYLGAPELADRIDNDCDGEVDEGTSLVDDDGDGFAEVDNDCDDTNPNIGPAEIEYCDGVDNNCNGLKDQRDGCIGADTEPIIIGGIQMDATAVGVGESTIMSVLVYDADNDGLAYAWQEDEALIEMGHNGLDSSATQTVTWTAPPALVGDATSETFGIRVVVTDGAINQAWALGDITVYANGVPDRLIDESAKLDEEGKKGCGSSSEDDEAAAQSLALPGLLALLLMGARRRRQDD